ncbi:outer membrane beta-barrel protein [Flavobacterium celericrescens]|uniref:Porin family protein n=1 Tax=Flavobacterium celericrescens TaxID=2709780 RepID=A0ABX0IH49_9FLAO|nr:outer membrane beta-barrel protein [Flavobacterium celericrescens]NHM04606.1 porin family protein [Flavobacterium celericrescens]
MKKVLFSAVALLAFGFANAQEESKGNGGFSKGDVFVTGAFTFGSTNDKDSDVKTNGFEIAPKVGYFLTENIAIGGKIGYSSMKEESSGVDTEDMAGLTVGAFGRYYFTPANQFSLFANLGLDYSSMENKLADSKVNGFDAGLGAGLNYFVSSNFSIEAGVAVLGFSSEKSDASGAKGTTGFNFGGDWRTVSFGVNYKF